MAQSTATDIPSQVFSSTLVSDGQSLAQLSKRHNVLLIFRRFIRFGGCAFCNRRLFQIAQIYNSLLQLNTVPVIVHKEGPEEVEQWLNTLDSDIFRRMLRIHDEEHKLAKEFNIGFEMPDIPAVLPKLTQISKNEGFTQPTDKKVADFEGDSFLIVPKMFLLRDCKVMKGWDHGLFGDTPDVISTLVFELSNLLVEDETTSDTSLESTSESETFMKRAPLCRRIRNNKKLAALEILTTEMKRQIEKNVTKEAQKAIKKKTPSERSSFIFVCFMRSSTLDEQNNSNNGYSVTLVDILNDERKLPFLKVYSYKELNAENVCFYEDVTKFKQVAMSQTDIGLKFRSATKIFHNYLSSIESPNYINTTESKRETVRKKLLETEHKDEEMGGIFDEVLQEIMQTVMPDIFLRFKNSKEFEEMLKVK